VTSGFSLIMGTSNNNERRSHITRRTFIKGTGAAGITLLVASRLHSRGKAEAKSREPEPSSGVVSEKFVNTSCLNCPSRCAINVRVVNGKAVRIAGNPLSRTSEGAICPRGHVGLQVLYDESRIVSPLKRTNPEKSRTADPGWQRISWEAALSDISTRLKALRDAGQPEALALFSGLNARSDEDLLTRFADAYGTPNLIGNASFDSDAEKTGRWLADGNYASVSYDLGKANYVLAFGASIVESERPLARNLRMWGKMRREKPARGKVVVIDPRYSMTAAKSDEWVPVNPGTDAALALAVASVLVSEGLYDKAFVAAHTTGFDRFQSVLARSYSPEQAAAATGVSAATIRRIAREFGGAKPALAWAGRGISAWPNGSLAVFAVFCLNALVGAIDAPGGVVYQLDPEYHPMPELKPDDVAKRGVARRRVDADDSPFAIQQGGATNRLPEVILTGSPYALKMGIGVNANFSMVAPGATKWDEALKKLPFYVHVAPSMTEMALFADIVLPATTFLEQWGYDHASPGAGFAELKVKQPVVAVENARSVGDIVFGLAGKVGGYVADSFGGIGDSAEGFVRFRTGSILPFEELIEKGVWVGPDYRYGDYARVLKTESGKFQFFSGALEKREALLSSVQSPGLPRYAAPVFRGDQKEFPYILTTYQPVLALEGGSQNYPWAQEVFLSMHGVGWTSLAELNGETAHKLGINDGDQVWLESPLGRLKMKARVTEWLHPGCIAVARGQGHYAPGKWQKGLGANPNDITAVDFDVLSGQSAMFNTRVKVYKA
jgi:thiosulfate reductase / polysulfide reductase chain A